jgi:hypothetical protein
MKTNRIPVQKQLIKDNQADTYPPEMRVNCAALARLFNVSRTSIKRFADSGLIELDAEGLADVKQATQAILNKSNHVKNNLLRSNQDKKQIEGLHQQIKWLTSKLLEAQRELDELKAVKQGNGTIH